MIITNSLATFGRYCMFLWRTLSLPDRWSVFARRTLQEVSKLGIDSIPLVLIISVFIGAVIAIQMQLNIASPLIPAYAVGLATRDIVLLEFSNSILCLILAGKVGSNIASEIGTMRVTEQIDALDIMGVNSANFLVLPKIVAFVGFMPVLSVLCMGTSILGGYGVAVFTDLITESRFLYGLQAFSRSGTYGTASSNRWCSRSSLPRPPHSTAIMSKAVPFRWVRPVPTAWSAAASSSCSSTLFSQNSCCND